MIEHEPALGDVARKQLQRIEGSAKGLMEALRDIVWSIDPDHDKLDDLLLYMKDVTHQLLGQGKIGYDLHFPQQVLVNKLSMEFRNNLFLTYKELLHNIRKHSGATYVHISLEKADGQLVLTVRDNGKGFDPCHATHGNGLKSIQARSHEMHAKLAIESTPGAGTKVKLTAKIP
jgi:signal transduction histidine kinase